MKEVQERYGGDRARVSQETMKMYREAGVNPIGCLGPLVIQMPILIGLFRVLIQTLFVNPDDLVSLADKLYPWITFVSIYEAAPLNNRFLGMNLAEPDPTNFVLPVLVAVSTWVQQKMTMTPSLDPRQQSSQNMMQWMIPLFLGVFSLGWPSGLPLYWIVSNIIGISIPVFHCRLGTPVPPVSQGYTRSGPRAEGRR